MTANAVPPPGSNEAIFKGCSCPVIDNNYGRGYYGRTGIFVYTIGCPVHASSPSVRPYEGTRP